MIARTIYAFDMIVANNNGVIKEDILQKYIDYVYPDWAEEDKIDYEDTKRILKNLYQKKWLHWNIVNRKKRITINNLMDIKYYQFHCRKNTSNIFGLCFC